MMKKFRKWRDKLTFAQVKKIMWIVGILTEVIITLNIIAYREQIITNPEKMPIWMVWIIESFIMIFAVEQIVYLILRGMEKELDSKRNEIEKKIAPKLKEDRFTEVYLKQEIRMDVDEVILDGYDAHEFRYFAKKKEDTIYVIMKEEEKIIKEYPHINYSAFEHHFSFNKEEK